MIYFTLVFVSGLLVGLALGLLAAFILYRLYGRQKPPETQTVTLSSWDMYQTYTVPGGEADLFSDEASANAHDYVRNRIDEIMDSYTVSGLVRGGPPDWMRGRERDR